MPEKFEFDGYQCSLSYYPGLKLLDVLYWENGEADVYATMTSTPADAPIPEGFIAVRTYVAEGMMEKLIELGAIDPPFGIIPAGMTELYVCYVNADNEYISIAEEE